MLFENCSRNNQALIQIDGDDIVRFHENTFLGAIMNKHMFKTAVMEKLSSSAVFHKSLHILYSSLILSYLNYYTNIWGNTYKCTVQPLYDAKRATMIILMLVRERTHFFFNS